MVSANVYIAQYHLRTIEIVEFEVRDNTITKINETLSAI